MLFDLKVEEALESFLVALLIDKAEACLLHQVKVVGVSAFQFFQAFEAFLVFACMLVAKCQ